MDIVKRRRMVELINEGMGEVEAYEIAFNEESETPSEPTEPTEPSEPSEPSEPTEPTDPTI